MGLNNGQAQVEQEPRLSPGAARVCSGSRVAAAEGARRWCNDGAARREVGETGEVVGGGGQFGPQLVAGPAPVAQLAARARPRDSASSAGQAAACEHRRGGVASGVAAGPWLEQG